MTNITWMLESAAREHPEKVAVVGPSEHEYTYEEFNALTSWIGNYLAQEHEIGPYDIVAGLIPDSAWTEAVLFGVMKTGAICTFENHTLPYDVLKANIENTGAKLALADERVFDEADRLAEEVDTIEDIVWFGESGDPLLQDVAPNYSDDLYPEPQTRDDVAVINYTAGTTGRPKGVQLTHGTLESSVRAITEAYHGLTSEDTMLLFLPMYHTGGISSSLFSVSAAASHIIAGGWDAQRVMELTRKYDPTWYTYIVPTMARDLMNQDEWGKFDVAGIKSYVAGEPVPADLQEALQDAGMRVSGTYGMTEVMPLAVTISAIAQEEDREMPAGAVGKPAEELGEVKIADLETNEEIVDPNQEGEVCFRGDNLTPGYYNDPERTKRAIDEDGWFHTDDLGYFDEEGFLYITGRADDMILSGGEKLSLIEVDDALLKSDLIEDGGTVGVPHGRFGTVPAALVVPRDPDMTEAELAENLDIHMKEHLAGWQRPRLYAVVDEIPRTPAKQTKIAPKLEEKLPDWLELDRDVSVTSLSKLNAEREG